MTTSEYERIRNLSASLDADESILSFIPRLLEDLWSLGFSPEPALALLRRAYPDQSDIEVLDVGCGKGALLGALVEEFAWHGRGIDLVPEFIAEANRHAHERGLDHLWIPFGRGLTAQPRTC